MWEVSVNTIRPRLISCPPKMAHAPATEQHEGPVVWPGETQHIQHKSTL